MIWLLLLVALGGFEIAALVSRRSGDTLSESTWDLYGIKKGSGLLTRAPLILFMGWLTVHLCLGVSTGPEAFLIVGTFVTVTLYRIGRKIAS